jgi:hypothetical protein
MVSVRYRVQLLIGAPDDALASTPAKAIIRAVAKAFGDRGASSIHEIAVTDRAIECDHVRSSVVHRAPSRITRCKRYDDEGDSEL